jgi:lipid A 3-O-deacylase
MKTYLLIAMTLFANKIVAQLIVEKSTNAFVFQNLIQTKSILNLSLIPQDSVHFALIAEKKIEIIPQKINYWRLEWSNDYLLVSQKSDRYYTNCIAFEHFFSKNGFNDRFLGNLFLKISPNADNYYGVFFRTEMYTPDTIWHVAPSNDRPYCGVTTVGMTMLSKQPETGAQLRSEYQIGMMGPVAMQGQLQYNWHVLNKKELPIGWYKQIPNDFVLNMRLTYEHPIVLFSNILEAAGVLDLNAGTLLNNVGLGFQLKMGNFDKNQEHGICFFDIKTEKKLKYVFKFKPIVYWVVQNSTLQGGFSLTDAERKPFIQLDDLTRMVSDLEWTHRLSYGNWALFYSYRMKSPEWKGGKMTFWGSLNLEKCF